MAWPPTRSTGSSGTCRIWPTPRAPGGRPFHLVGHYIRADRDATVGPTAARLTADFVSGPYRFETVPGVGHFVTDEAPAAITRLLLSHLGAQR
jgi:pimeloyl-ACP methyl ester carboxylesterase